MIGATFCFFWQDEEYAQTAIILAVLFNNCHGMGSTDRILIPGCLSEIIFYLIIYDPRGSILLFYSRDI